ncbi:hypothetical protein VTI28DRAFT_550 [Corynascus sepedonium]
MLRDPHSGVVPFGGPCRLPPLTTPQPHDPATGRRRHTWSPVRRPMSPCVDKYSCIFEPAHRARNGGLLSTSFKQIAELF